MDTATSKTGTSKTGTARTDLRRIVLAVTIASFSIAALTGIGALLGPGEFGETGVRVLLTTVVVGCASVVTLCCLAVVGGRFQLVGVLGFLLAVATAALGLFLVWDWSDDIPESIYETFGVAITVSLTLAQICLLLGLAGVRRSLASLMWPTVALALVVAGMVSVMVTGYDPSDAFLRALGVVAILDVLGTLVTIALGVFGRDHRALSVTLPPALAARLRAESAASGRPVPELVDEAVARYYGTPVD
jgi:hypothetical protein